jgi:hypothetical protein
MKDEKNSVIYQTKEQANCYLADPRDFVVVEEGVPFHGQCGDSDSQYRRLLSKGEVAANASTFSEEMEEHPDVNSAKRPHTP